MRDFNFFDTYKQKGSRKEFKKGYLYVGVLFVGVILFITFTYAFNYITMSKLKSEIVDIQKQLDSKENIEKLKEAETEEKKLALMNQYYDIVTNISDTINSKNFLDSKVLEKINSCVPQGVYFKVLTLDKNGLELEGEGKDRESIAVFERTLRNLDIVEEVHVSTIKSETRILNFKINCILKDVDNYESK